MINFHFLKGIFEAMVVDRLAGRVFPIRTTLWTALFYWIGMGMVGFSLYHPELLEELENITAPISSVSKYLPS